MAKAGASYVVVMGRAHEATVRRVVDAAKKYDIGVMGDNLAAEDRIANAVWLESLGVDIVIHHIGCDERRLVKGLSPMDELDDVVEAVSVPVQAVGGLSIRQAISCPRARRASRRASARRSSSTPTTSRRPAPTCTASSARSAARFGRRRSSGRGAGGRCAGATGA